MFFRRQSGPAEWILACLGNYGQKYENTRHNIGFMAADRLVEKRDLRCNRLRFRALTEVIDFGGARVLLMKPQTYMNLSGESVRRVLDFYKVDETQELIVISDDISLDVGRLRIRKKGSAGGHNGLKNIILHLGHGNFHRIKVGVGEKPTGYDLADYVLGHFSKEEQKVMEETAKRAVEALLVMMNEGADAAMNQFN